MKIYVVGNPLVDEDSAPLRMLPQLKKSYHNIDFQTVDPNENFPPEREKNLIIIDTVKGIKKPTILDLDDLEVVKKTPVSPHDYDLLFHLLLLKKTKRLGRILIIGVASKDDLPQVKQIISTLP